MGGEIQPPLLVLHTGQRGPERGPKPLTNRAAFSSLNEGAGFRLSETLGEGSQATPWERSGSHIRSTLHRLQACSAPAETGCVTQSLAHRSITTGVRFGVCGKGRCFPRPAPPPGVSTWHLGRGLSVGALHPCPVLAQPQSRHRQYWGSGAKDRPTPHPRPPTTQIHTG